MRYQLSYYTQNIGEGCKFMIGSILSFQFAFSVVFTGLFAASMLDAFGVSPYIRDAVFMPCAMFFLWSFCMSAIDTNIERDVL